VTGGGAGGFGFGFAGFGFCLHVFALFFAPGDALHGFGLASGPGVAGGAAKASGSASAKAAAANVPKVRVEIREERPRTDVRVSSNSRNHQSAPRPRFAAHLPL
jgi:hypothetical protein